MSTESQKSGPSPVHKDVSFEERDIKVSTIYWYLLALGIATVAAAVICVYILQFADASISSSETPVPASKQAMGGAYRTMPPEPRLQGMFGHESDPQKDLREKRAADLAANEKLEWVDKNAGIAQIPVKEAMNWIAEKGLPAVAPAPGENK